MASAADKTIDFFFIFQHLFYLFPVQAKLKVTQLVIPPRSITFSKLCLTLECMLNMNRAAGLN